MARSRFVPIPTICPAPQHPADVAIWSGKNTHLDPAHHADANAFRKAYECYELEDEDTARDTLASIGLQSPFLQWKLFLRGLMAYSAQEDARAIENWQRLAPDRLPFRLACPLRASIDAAFRASQSDQARLALDHQYQALLNNPDLPKLQTIRQYLATKKALKTPYRLAESFVPRWKRTHPDLVPRLAAVFYQALYQSGNPSDLPFHRTVFGSPPDDPDFHLLQAQILEQIKSVIESGLHWASYEKWLESNPPGWPADVLRRARAICRYERAELAEMAPSQSSQQRLMDSFSQISPRTSSSKPEDPIIHYRKSLQYDPTWEAPAQKLVQLLMEAEQQAEAETVARAFLERVPQSNPMRRILAKLLTARGKSQEVLDLWLSLVADHPLDATVREAVGVAYLSHARRLLVQGDLNEAESTLDQGLKYTQESSPVMALTLRSLIHRARGQTEKADQIRTQALGIPEGRLLVLYQTAVIARMARWKPPIRKPLEADLVEALAGPATPRETYKLYTSWHAIPLEGYTYRGYEAHEKKIQALVLRSAESDGSEVAFEDLLGYITRRHHWKLAKKSATTLRRRFPANPFFPWILISCEVASGKRLTRTTQRLLMTTRALVVHSPEPRHKALLPMIDNLIGQFGPHGGFLDIPIW